MSPKRKGMKKDETNKQREKRWGKEEGVFAPLKRERRGVGEKEDCCFSWLLSESRVDLNIELCMLCT